MTLQQLEYIVALDTHRHFVTAAEHCFVTQPTLTMQVKKLEEEIGIQLFDRTKHPLEPTTQGEIIISKARNILRETRALKAMVSNERESITGTFKIGIIPTIAPYLLPSFLKDFGQHHPDTHLVIEELKSEEIIARLNNDTLDLAILSTPLEVQNIREIPLYNEPFVVYAHKEHPIHKKNEVTIKQLPKDGLWLLQQGHCFRNQTLNVCEYEPKESRTLTYESGSIDSIRRLVMIHGGYTLLPEMAVNLKVEESQIIQFKGKIPTREISIVVNHSFVKERLIEEFHRFILAQVPENYQKNERFIKVKWR